MKPRIFLDTNVFIYAFEFPHSNSATIITLLNKGELEGITSEKVLEEITLYFTKHYTIKIARQYRKYVLETCTIVAHNDVLEEIEKLKEKIKDKDREQLAVVKKYSIKYLISYDKDFDPFPEYHTPQKFLKLLTLPHKDTEY